MAFLYGFRLTVHAVFTVPASQVFLLEFMIREGVFDRFLVRPVNPMVQVLASRISFSVLGDLIGGVGLLAVVATMVDVDRSAASIGFLLLAILGGAAVEFAIHLTVSTLGFRLLSVRSFRVTVDEVFGQFDTYPMAIFPSVLRFGLTFVLPLAFAAYLPATVLLDRTDELSISSGFAYAAPLVGVDLALTAYGFWT